MAVTASALPRPARARTVEVADLFCGAGGITTGIQRACDRLDLRMNLVCVNHWLTAIATHQANYPNAYHICSDIAAVRPLAAVPKGRLDLLAAAPSCVYFSRARGGKPVHDQQRTDPWHLITWLTDLRVRCVLFENVPEIQFWGPVNPRTGKPLKSRRGEYFHAWIAAIRALGYKVQYRVLNCADYGDATTRKRFFLIARNDGKPLRWPDPTHARNPIPVHVGDKPLKRWRAAREIIDWSLLGKSIFDRKKPLSPKTLMRVYAGLIKFEWPGPFLIALRNHMRAQGVDVPLPTVTAGGTHLALVQPFLFANRNNNVGKNPDTDPIPTACSRGNVTLVEPFLATVAHGNEADERDPHSRRAHSLEDPLGTIHGDGRSAALVTPANPFVLNRHGENGGTRAHSVDAPLPTSDCRGAGYLVRPFVFRMNQGKKRVSEQRHVDDPLGTITASGTDLGLVEPADPRSFILSQASGGAPRSTDEPVPAVTTDGAHAFLAPYYSHGSGKTGTSVDQPMPAATAKARFGLVVPLTHRDKSNRARDVNTDPLPTVTSAHRGELGFIAASFGERAGQAPRVHDIQQPVPTIPAQGRTLLVQPGSGRQYDILLRMLTKDELARAHSLHTATRKYEFRGTATDIVRQIGNSVPGETAAALAGALLGEI